jgi:hypothetical protein
MIFAPTIIGVRAAGEIQLLFFKKAITYYPQKTSIPISTFPGF